MMDLGKAFGEAFGCLFVAAIVGAISSCGGWAVAGLALSGVIG